MKKGSISRMLFVLGVVVITTILLPSIVVTFSLHNNILINDAEAHSATIPVGIRPLGIEYDPSNDKIYVANGLSVQYLSLMALQTLL